MALDTEEEQVEKMQKYWEDYKRSIIAVIVILLGAYGAFNFYTNQSIKNLEIASQLYQEILIEKITAIESITEKVTLLKKTSSNTPYASRSAIYLSKLYSQDNKKESAIKGFELLKKMIDKAKTQLTIIPAGKITYKNIDEIHQLIGANEYHGRNIVTNFN